MQHKAKLVCGKTFEALLQDLQEKAVLKSSKQLSEAIQHLCFFEADPALLQTMVNLIVHGNIQSGDREGRVVLRLAHYFASSLPPVRHFFSLFPRAFRACFREFFLIFARFCCCQPSTLANMQTKVVAKQVAHKQLNRRLIALRTLSVAASDSDVRTDLQKLIQSVLNNVEAQATAGALSVWFCSLSLHCLLHFLLTVCSRLPRAFSRSAEGRREQRVHAVREHGGDTTATLTAATRCVSRRHTALPLVAWLCSSLRVHCARPAIPLW